MSEPIQLGTYHMVGRDSFEPQRTNNFEVQITGLDSLTSVDKGTSLASNASELITLSVATYSAPSINISPITVSYGNNKIKFAGLPEFPDSQIVLNDYIGADIEKILTAWQKLAYNPKNQKVGNASVYKKTGYLREFSPDGSICRQWAIFGMWISNLSLGEFNQEGGNVRQITCTLQYDYCYPMDTDDTSLTTSSYAY